MHHTDYLHGGVFHRRIYSLPNLCIRQTGLENINQESIICTAAKDHEAGAVCFEHDGIFFPAMRHIPLLFTSHRTDHHHLMAQGYWNAAAFFFFLQLLIGLNYAKCFLDFIIHLKHCI